MKSAISIEFTDELKDEQTDSSHLVIRGHDCWEINIWMTKAEIKMIPNVRTARWSERTCLHIGKCTGVQTCWSCEDGNLSILVGHDDECWQFGIIIPESELDNIIAKIGH